MKNNLMSLDFTKIDGLLPVIVQDAATHQVLMLGYMNDAALQQTLNSGWVTFYSRSKQRLWMKGESSGFKLKLVDITADCDQDALLVLAKPLGPTCHTGDVSCFPESTFKGDFLGQLEGIIAERQKTLPADSYTTQLFQAGVKKIAQKVGEEGVEVALAAVVEDDDALCGEVADLLFHVLVLLRVRGLGVLDVVEVLRGRCHKG